MELKQDPNSLSGFPALDMCVVIDARISSRKEILRDLMATNLFQNMVEAMSLDNGLELVAQNSVDACFIGPAVSVVKAASFIQQAVESERSKHCAFIAIAEEAERRVELEQAGSHQVIEKPYSKEKFAECIVRGVVKANAGSGWGEILQRAEKGETNPFARESIGDSPKKASATERMGSALLDAAPQMKAMIAEIEAGNYTLTPQGEPDDKANQALSRLLDTILATTDNDYRPFFESALTRWFLDVHEKGTKEANEHLKVSMTSFFTSSKG